MERLKIWLLSIVAAVVYGICQDQVTARVCVEYFTLGHPPVFHTSNPTLLAFGWGFIASWWMGAILGVPLAWAARNGPERPFSAVELVRPIAWLLGFMAAGAFLSGVVGYVLAASGNADFVMPFLPPSLPPDRWNVFIADAFAHQAAYTLGFIGGMGVCIWARFTPRRKRQVAAP